MKVKIPHLAARIAPNAATTAIATTATYARKITATRSAISATMPSWIHAALRMASATTATRAPRTGRAMAPGGVTIHRCLTERRVAAALMVPATIGILARMEAACRSARSHALRMAVTAIQNVHLAGCVISQPAFQAAVSAKTVDGPAQRTVHQMWARAR